MFEVGSRISHTLKNGDANMLPIDGLWGEGPRSSTMGSK